MADAQSLRRTLIAAIAFGCAFLAGRASAQTQQQIDWCYSPTATDDQTISGCSAMIESGHYSSVDLSAAYNNRSTGYTDKGEWDLAIGDLEKSAQIDPKNAESFNNLGGLYLEKHEYNRAIATFGQAITLRPNYANAFVYRGLTYAKLGNPAKAEHDFDEAMVHFEEQIAGKPGDPLYYFKRCRARAIWNRQLDLALVDCGKALELNPHYADALDSKGVIRYRSKNYADAIENFNAALLIDPARPGSLYVRGLAKLRSGDTTGGRADIKSAEVIDAKIAEELALYGLGE